MTDKHGNVTLVPYEAEKDYLRGLGDEKVSKLQIMKRMRGFVEDYSFDDYFLTTELGTSLTKKKGEIQYLPNA